MLNVLSLICSYLHIESFLAENCCKNKKRGGRQRDRKLTEWARTVGSLLWAESSSWDHKVRKLLQKLIFFWQRLIFIFHLSSVGFMLKSQIWNVVWAGSIKREEEAQCMQVFAGFNFEGTKNPVRSYLFRCGCSYR